MLTFEQRKILLNTFLISMSFSAKSVLAIRSESFLLNPHFARLSAPAFETAANETSISAQYLFVSNPR